ncbi:MAG: hypothetical protein I3I98_03045 [Mobilibacterium timonense]|uniref:hypothetical protein n=1 Tax=Mobilibacterium timonense TaxID=1871012 RepID=UPI002357C1D7|nr:hypothetical protein [Mobilibacterium timonense]MBM6990371.1 hypothetical protein [Mobilibacterium timonense]
MENVFTKDLANGLTLEFLENTPAGSMLQSAISTYSKVQTLLLRLSSAEDEGSLTALKIGTVLTEAFLEKFLQGKAPQDLTRADLAEITDRVTDFAVLMDGRDYSVFVFEQYARYIEFSAKLLAARSDARSTDQIGSILAVSQEIRNNSRKLHDGEISEPEYIEACLWLSLEAILKCFSAYLSCTTGMPEFGMLAQSISMLAFEYGRLMACKKEQAVLDASLKSQQQLDENLSEEFEAFKNRLEAEEAQFNELIANAFAPDFRDSLRSSAALASAAGVKEEDVLRTASDIDRFFME